VLLLIFLGFGNKAMGQTWNCGYPILSSVTATFSNNNLTISGSGLMGDYWNPDNDSLPSTPWWNIRGSIYGVTINEGVTSVGDGAFYDCTNLAGVSLAHSITRIMILNFIGGGINLFLPAE